MATIKMAFLLVLFVTACCSPMLKVSGTEFGMKRSIGCVGDSDCSKEKHCRGAGRDGKCIDDNCRCLLPPEFGMKPSIGCVADYECSSKKEGQCSWAGQDGKCIHGICRCSPPPAQERKKLDAGPDAAKQHCVRDPDCAKYCPRGCKLMNCLNGTCFCEC